jgi:hypothetical protein
MRWDVGRVFMCSVLLVRWVHILNDRTLLRILLRERKFGAVADTYKQQANVHNLRPPARPATHKATASQLCCARHSPGSVLHYMRA